MSALEPTLRERGGRWIGWPGAASEDLGRRSAWHPPLRAEAGDLAPVLSPVSLSRAEIRAYYSGFANGVLWPLFHGLVHRCDFGAGGFEVYRRVNRRFGDAAHEATAGRSALIWIHDYHLLGAASRLRERGTRARLGFFLHTPFPTLDDLVKLPWRGAILRALLAHDVIGFQTPRDLRRFLSCAETLELATVRSRGGCDASLAVGQRVLRAGVYPIGIDPEPFSRPREGGGAPDAAAEVRRAVGARPVVLGVDRLDYTKGLLERLAAYERALERFPELRERVALVQVVVPSRESVPAYAALRREIERRVGQIHGRFATPSWAPVRYLYSSVSPDELLALYREAQVLMVTPLADGMNLVAKEYCAARVDEGGALILSEMAGAASQLQGGAVLVNPYDEEGMADALRRALAMPAEERGARMRRMRAVVREHDVRWWARHFLASLAQDAPPPPSPAECLPTVDLPDTEAETPAGARGRPPAGPGTPAAGP